MNTIKRWFMMHFYQDIYKLYLIAETQQEMNKLLNDKLEDLNERLFYLENKAIKGLMEIKEKEEIK